MFTLSPADSTFFQVSLVDSAGDQWPALSDATLVGTSVESRTYIITTSGSPQSSGNTPNAVWIGAGASLTTTGVYFCVTYVEVVGHDQDIQHWHNNAGTLKSIVNSSGQFGIGITSALGGMLHIQPSAAGTIGEIIRGASSQTADLTEWQNSAGSILSRIKSDGTFEGPISTTGAVSVQDSTFSIFDNVTPTKIAQFQCATIGAGTTKTFTFPNASGTLPTLENAHTVTGAWTLGDATQAITAPSDGSGGYTGVGFLLRDIIGGFNMQLTGPTGGLTADRIIQFPDANAVVVGTTAQQTITNKTFGTGGNLLKVTTASTGVAFSDNTTATKQLRFILSGAGAFNHSITLTNSGQAHNYGLGDIQGMIPIVGDDPPAIAAGSLGKVDLTAQVAGIGSTNLSNTPPAGLYWVDVYAACTTASGSGAPTLDVNIAWTDVVGATNRNCTAEPGATAFPLSLAGTGRTSASMFIQVASGNIAYTTTINAASGTPQYAIYIRVTYLG
jgi:hypothetical protein